MCMGSILFYFIFVLRISFRLASTFSTTLFEDGITIRGQLWDSGYSYSKQSRQSVIETWPLSNAFIYVHIHTHIYIYTRTHYYYWCILFLSAFLVSEKCFDSVFDRNKEAQRKRKNVDFTRLLCDYPGNPLGNKFFSRLRRKTRRPPKRVLNNPCQ